jgi:hypothetical protein
VFVYDRDTFFAPAFLEKQLKDKLGSFADSKVVEEKLQLLLDSPEFEAVLDKKLASLGSSPMGVMLSMLSLNASKIKPFVKVGALSITVRAVFCSMTSLPCTILNVTSILRITATQGRYGHCTIPRPFSS